MNRRRSRSNLATRVATAIIGIPLLLAVDWAGGKIFAALIGLAALVAAFETIRLLRAIGLRPAAWLVLPAAPALAILPAFEPGAQPAWIEAIVLIAFLAGAYYLLPDVMARGLGGWAATVGASLYAGLLLGHLTLLREAHHGARWIVLVLVATWAYDTGAYFAGRGWGRHPFMAHVSAKKTWEGTLGGLLLATVAGVVGAYFVGFWPAWGALLGFLIGVVAQVGDLIESMFKRQAGVKDSGTIMPGHGGLLDRIDSLLFTGVLGFYAAALLGYAT